MRAGRPWNATRSECELEPALQKEVVREELAQRPVDRCDVVRIPREHGPAEGADAAAEERPDIGRDKARVCERVLDACLLRLPPKVVAVIENIAPGPDELEHALDVARDRLRGSPQILVGVVCAKLGRLVDREPDGHVAVQRVVGGCLVGDEVEGLAARRELGHDLGRVARAAPTESARPSAAALRTRASASSSESDASSR